MPVGAENGNRTGIGMGRIAGPAAKRTESRKLVPDAVSGLPIGYTSSKWFAGQLL